MNAQAAKIATICECIDHCFAFAMWCEDFARHVDPDDMVAGLDRAFDLMSDATRLQSFLALRKLDDFFGGVKPKPDDLIAANFGIDVLGDTFLSAEERESINKGAAHLTEKLTLDPDSEVALSDILTRSTPVLSRLVTELRKSDTAKEAAYWLDRTDALIERARQQHAKGAAQNAGPV